MNKLINVEYYHVQGHKQVVARRALAPLEAMSDDAPRLMDSDWVCVYIGSLKVTIEQKNSGCLMKLSCGVPCFPVRLFTRTVEE